jgi:hypothetical protein
MAKKETTSVTSEVTSLTSIIIVEWLGATSLVTAILAPVLGLGLTFWPWLILVFFGIVSIALSAYGRVTFPSRRLQRRDLLLFILTLILFTILWIWLWKYVLMIPGVQT